MLLARTPRTFLTVLAATLALLSAPTAALAAASPLADQYGAPTGVDAEAPGAEAPAGDTSGAGDITTLNASVDTVGSIPFTGAELRYLALAGAALIGSGLMMRRVGYGRSSRIRA